MTELTWLTGGVGIAGFMWWNGVVGVDGVDFGGVLGYGECKNTDGHGRGEEEDMIDWGDRIDREDFYEG